MSNSTTVRMPNNDILRDRYSVVSKGEMVYLEGLRNCGSHQKIYFQGIDNTEVDTL